MAGGRLGRKTGTGFYAHEGEQAGRPAQAPATAGTIDAGEIVGRILEAIEREAELARDEGVATEADIDLALRLGAGHPEGPFERRRRRSAG